MHKKGEQLELNERYIRWFSSLGKNNVKEVGGKAANLGEMFNIGMPVPQGFAVIAKAYEYFLEKTGLKQEIYKILSEIDIENTEELDNVSEKIKKMIVNAEMPLDLQKEVIEAYTDLSINRDMMENASYNALAILKFQEPIFVAVRSSATAEDSPEASFAGQQETFLNVKGKEMLIESVKQCWASLFTARSIYYRIKKGFKHENVLIAVVVQQMINSDKSGVIFSKDPVENTGNVVIEAVYGLGEGIVSGRIEPDHYIVDKELKIVDKRTANKKVAIIRTSEGKNSVVELTEERSTQQVLTDSEIRRLANYALQLEEHYAKPQDIEFAISSNEIFIVQTRPITTLGLEVKKQEVEGKELISGLAASPGIGSGEVKVVRDLKDLEKIRKGDILVTEMTNPDMVVSMQRASAIVTDEGGSTCHAAIVSREMGIPAVVGTKKATRVLRDGLIITVDGFKGKVYEGRLEILNSNKLEIKPIVETKIKIKAIVDLPDFAERAAKTKCRDVGLTRIEGIIAESGKHPFYFLKHGIEGYEDILYTGISKIAGYFDEVWVRTSDIRSDEYKHLQGAPQKLELNPMLGMHGIRAGLKYPEILKAEIRALSRVKKAAVMMPQVISVEELKEVKKILKETNIKIKVGVMIETPAAVQIIEDLCKEGIDFISFGTNDLTQFTLALDRGNEDVQYLYDETHPAVLRQLAHVISVCKKYGVETSICGQAGSDKDMVEFLVKNGIDSISVNADKAGEISEFVRDLEQKGLRGTKEYKIEERKEQREELVEEKKEKEKKEKMNYNVKCSRCGKDTEVPFKPDGVRPVYCKICLEVKRQEKNFPATLKEELKDTSESLDSEGAQKSERTEKISDIEKKVKEVREEAKKEEKEEKRQEEIKQVEKIVEKASEEKKDESVYTKVSEEIISENEKSAEELIEDSLDIF